MRPADFVTYAMILLISLFALTACGDGKSSCDSDVDTDADTDTDVDTDADTDTDADCPAGPAGGSLTCGDQGFCIPG